MGHNCQPLHNPIRTIMYNSSADLFRAKRFRAIIHKGTFLRAAIRARKRTLVYHHAETLCAEKIGALLLYYRCAGCGLDWTKFGCSPGPPCISVGEPRTLQLLHWPHCSIERSTSDIVHSSYTVHRSLHRQVRFPFKRNRLRFLRFSFTQRTQHKRLRLNENRTSDTADCIRVLNHMQLDERFIMRSSR